VEAAAAIVAADASKYKGAFFFKHPRQRRPSHARVQERESLKCALSLEHS
jgi:hypothetical protein